MRVAYVLQIVGILKRVCIMHDDALEDDVSISLADYVLGLMCST